MAEDDRTGKRPKTFMGDAERAVIGRQRRTPAYGIPVEIDPEQTPPPATPPTASDAPAEVQLAELRTVAAQQSEAITRLWDSRNAGGQIARMQAALDALVKDSAQSNALLREFIMPATKQTLARLDALERAVNTEGGRQERFFEHDWPRVMNGIEKLDRRTDLIERQLDRQDRNAEAATKRADDKYANAMERIEAIEKREGITANRVRRLEDFNLSLRAKVAIVSAGLSGLVAVAVWAAERYL